VLRRRGWLRNYVTWWKRFGYPLGASSRLLLGRNNVCAFIRELVDIDLRTAALRLIADLSRENVYRIYLIDLNIVVSCWRKLLYLLLSFLIYPYIKLFRLITFLEHPCSTWCICISSSAPCFIRGGIRCLWSYWRNRCLWRTLHHHHHVDVRNMLLVSACCLRL